MGRGLALYPHQLARQRAHSPLRHPLDRRDDLDRRRRKVRHSAGFEPLYIPVGEDVLDVWAVDEGVGGVPLADLPVQLPAEFEPQRSEFDRGEGNEF